ncbi:MAG: histidine--tRNA ligase [Gemmatimonadota bacterium]
MEKISSLPGFRDFYPGDLALRNHIFRGWRRVAERYGFVEYDGPPLEPLELYTRKSGEEIVEQLYAFEDRGGREVALRPEMTPTFARLVSARARALPKPIKWYSLPQLFRYERPQRGRLREHFQLNLDIVGEEDVLADAELVAAAVDVLREFGLDEDDVEARINDRRLAAGLLRDVGVEGDALQNAFAALDKADRESREWVLGRLGEAGADPDAAADLLEELEAAGPDEIVDRAAGASEDAAAAAERLRRLFRHLDDFGVGDYVRYDAGLVRGLAYYTGTVFELWDRGGELRAVCGGGRYDDLLASLGGVDLPALGFGMGDVVLAELLRDRGLAPEPDAGLDDFVVVVSEEQRSLALELVHALRERGRSVGFDYRARSVGRQFGAADQAGARRAILLGPDEVGRGRALVREMATGEEEELQLERLMEGEESA